MLYIMVRRARAIGLVYPSESTVASMVSIVKVVDASIGARENSAEDTHKLILEYKRINKLKRHGVPKTADAFPEAAADFIAKYPSTYAADDGPVACPYDVLDVDRAKSTTAARKSHASLKPAGADDTAVSKGSAMCHLQQLTTALMHHVMRSSREVGLPGLQIFPSTPPARKPLLALANGEAVGSNDDAAGGSPQSTGTARGGASPTAVAGAPPCSATFRRWPPKCIPRGGRHRCRTGRH